MEVGTCRRATSPLTVLASCALPTAREPMMLTTLGAVPVWAAKFFRKVAIGSEDVKYSPTIPGFHSENQRLRPSRYPNWRRPAGSRRGPDRCSEELSSRLAASGWEKREPPLQMPCMRELPHTAKIATLVKILFAFIAPSIVPRCCPGDSNSRRDANYRSCSRNRQGTGEHNR